MPNNRAIPAKNSRACAVRFSPMAASARAYSGSEVRANRATQLQLDRNEGPAPCAALRAALTQLSSQTMQRYPSAAQLERALAERVGVDSAQVVATAGGDDAIDRLIRATSGLGRDTLIHTPTFEMIEVAATLAGARVRRVDWLRGAFPADAMLGAIDEGVGCVALVSPNNPTGLPIAESDLLRVADAAARVEALTLVDLAYVEFARDDPTAALLSRPNVAIVRTFSKAWGLAGLRVGYMAAGEAVANVARALGGPFNVAGPSLALALHALSSCEAHMQPAVQRIRCERKRLSAVLRALGAEVEAGEANFVLARLSSARAARTAHAELAEQGVLVRSFPRDTALADSLRITCPCNEKNFDRLETALRIAMRTKCSAAEGEPE